MDREAEKRAEENTTKWLGQEEEREAKWMQREEEHEQRMLSLFSSFMSQMTSSRPHIHHTTVSPHILVANFCYF